VPVKKRTVRKRKLFPESQVQCDLLKWMSLYCPSARKCVIRIMNEGKRTASGHVLAVSMGMHVGAADLMLCWPNSRYAGLFLEVKPPGYKVTPSKEMHHQRQVKFAELMRSMGYCAEFGVGLSECIRVVTEYLTIR
jgi:hypothetical protein